MALKFLNKKGWHTGSLRNIENVWKAEQKRDVEEKKLEELRKQIQEERERTEFRRLQEQAGLVPKQERLDFLYDSGLSVGRPANSEGFKELEAFPKNDSAAPSSSASGSAQKTSAPGALFEEKPHSANDTWRKLHSDPLLLIRQREQEALERIKNNPVKMATILKSVDRKKGKGKKPDKKEKHKKHRSPSKHHKHSSSRQQSDSEDDIAENTRRKIPKYIGTNSVVEASWRRKSHRDLEYRDQSPNDPDPSRHMISKEHNRDADGRDYDKSRRGRYHSEGQRNSSATHNKDGDGERYRRSNLEAITTVSVTAHHRESHYKLRNIAPKLTDEERASRLKEMQLAAELHEEQRWKRLKKADEEDARETVHANTVSVGKNFLEAAQKSVYGTVKGGSSTIAESVRRRTHYLQDRSEASEGNAFRR